MEPTHAPGGWHPDPTGRFEFRYYNGQRWTADVSVHGQRFIDDVGPATATYQPGWGPTSSIDRPPPRGMAIASFVVALVSLLVAWIPFLFVLGAAGAITSLVLGIVAIRRVQRNEGAGRGFATWGVVLSIAALLLCVVGFLLTLMVIREVDEFFDPGPYDVTINRCETADGLTSLDGSITNRDTGDHDYTIVVEYTSDGDIVSSDQTRVRDVSPGETAEFHTTAFVDADQVQCEVANVFGN